MARLVNFRTGLAIILDFNKKMADEQIDTRGFVPTEQVVIQATKAKRKRGRPKKRCNLCHQFMPRGSSLHRCVGRLPGSYKCPHLDCNRHKKGFDLDRNLKNHLRRVHAPAVPVNCPICNVKIRRKEYLKSHMKTHKQEPLKCKFCKTFKTHSSAALKEHINAKHTHNKQYVCTLCGYKTFSKYDFNRHNSRQHRKTR